MTPERWRQIEDLYHLACDQGAGVLANADPELRRKVQELLAQNSAGKLLDHVAFDRMADSTRTQVSAGAQLGPYKIEALLGQGGMGQVFRAVDTRLGRAVAIKVSQERFTDRFEREARAIAALNHPNICILHDVGPDYLVMELIEGPTLAERIAPHGKPGPVPMVEALGIAKQIAYALEAAHEKSIVHRDLKPANVKIRPDGSVKVLDFGLAKTGEHAEATADSSTIMTAMSIPGMILGTAPYMSPEQAAGQPVDKRADIWAFGVVLYEVLTGKRLFQGDSTAQVLADVLRRPVDLEKLPEETPGRVRELMKRCLDRDVRNRLRDIGEARVAIEAAGVGEADGATAAPSQSPQSRFGKGGWIAAAVLAVVAGAGWYRARPHADELKQLARLDVDLGASVSLGSSGGASAMLSPDGTRLVYVSQGKLFTRRMDQPRAVELAGTEGAIAPFFSPDGQWVAFFASGKLKKISAEGGAAVALCDASAYPRGGSWGQDGNIIAALDSEGGVLSRIPATGGAPVAVTALAQGEVSQRYPQILPGGKAVLFTSGTSSRVADSANIEVVALADSGADHRRKTLVRGGTFGRYVPASNGTGYLVYINKGTLFAVPFDPDKLEARGTPSPVLGQVSYDIDNGFAQFDTSQNGTLVYRGGGATGANLVTVQWLDAAGRTEPLLAKPGVYVRPRLSPDGQRLALDDGSDLWVYEARRDTMTRLTFDGGPNTNQVWSPDGRYIAFSGLGGGIWWVRSDGAGKPQPLLEGKNALYPWSFTPDGKRLAYEELKPAAAYIWTVPIESDGAGMRAGKPEIFLQTSADERHPAFSPDGNWLAYSSDESGKHEVYVRAFPDKGGKWQISNAGGVYPYWSRSGHELFFRGDDSRIMVATYAVKADSFIPDKPIAWSDKRPTNVVGMSSNYDPAPDGKRIAAVMPAETSEGQATQNHVTFLLNFGDELRRKVPVGK
jgi:Tol biopolymer transport system component